MMKTGYAALWAVLMAIWLMGAASAREIKIGIVLPLSGGGAQFGD